MSTLLARISLRQRPNRGRKCLLRVFLAPALEPATEPLFRDRSFTTSRYATTIHDGYDHSGSVVCKDIRRGRISKLHTMERNNDGERWKAHSRLWKAHPNRDARDFYTERVDIDDNWPRWPEGVARSFDWRDPEHDGVLPPVSTQIGGTCAYYAVCDLLSTNYKIATGKFRKFSVQWLIDGVPRFPKREAGMSDKRYQELVDTEVGSPCRAIFHFIEEKGIVLEDDYKTTGKIKPLEPISRPHKKYSLNRHGLIDNGNMRHLLEEITRGPVYAALEIDWDFDLLNAGEVYRGNDKPDRVIIEDAEIMYPDLGWHAVLLTGFREQSGTPSIVVRNSHGEEWSEGGYGYVHRTIPSLLVRAYYAHLEPLEDDEDEPEST